MAASHEPLARLRWAPLELLGRVVESSNATFLMAVGELPPDDPQGTDGDAPLTAVGAEVAVGAPTGEPPGRDADDEDGEDGEDEDGDGNGEGRTPTFPPGLKGIYKPLRGERPLWDFPEGLYRREIAAYELSVALGWDVVPATVERDDVLGVGSLQRFVDADFSRHYFVLRDAGDHDDQLRRMCAFDLLANNTDRKGGHVLVDAKEHVWGIDNGLCFSLDARLRTVIWDFAGEPVPDDLMDDVVALIDRGLPAAVTDHLFDDEVEGVLHRARLLRSARQFPHDPTGRCIPWPLI